MAEKLRGTKVWVPTLGHLRPAPGQRPGWVLGAGGGRSLPLWGSGGNHTRKFFENFDAKSCILVTDYLLWNFLLFENYSQEVGDQYIVGSPTWPVSPGPYGCCALELDHFCPLSVRHVPVLCPDEWRYDCVVFSMTILLVVEEVKFIRIFAGDHP